MRPSWPSDVQHDRYGDDGLLFGGAFEAFTRDGAIGIVEYR